MSLPGTPSDANISLTQDGIIIKQIVRLMELLNKCEAVVWKTGKAEGKTVHMCIRRGKFDEES